MVDTVSFIQHQTGHFQSADGAKLFYRHWFQPGVEPCAVLVLIHGMGGHSGLFEHIAEVLAPQGVQLYAPDWRGNGQSPGRRGYINNWDELRGDVRSFLAFVDQQAPTLPRFILGHSVGGAIVLDYVMRFPKGFQGAVISNPTLGAIGVSPIKLAIAKLLSNLWPSFSLSTGMDLTTGARDPAVQASHASDPLRHATGSARLATEYMATADWIQTHAADLQVPLLMIQGGADRVSLPEGSRRFFNQVTFPDKTWHEYPESCHEIYDDLDYPQVIQDLWDWLQSRLSSYAQAD
jgi:alpha-beta hydrolase superfamily lysophospholipase